MDRRIRLRHLQAFVEIVRQGSLKRAAEELFLTQPAISRTLAEFEEIVGSPLLIRGRGGVRLTPEGQFLHGHALSGLAALSTGLAGLAGGAGDRLRVGVLPSVAARLMPAVAAELLAVAPGVMLEVSDGSHEHLTKALRAGDLEAVIGRLGAPQTMQGLSFTQLYLEEVAVVVRPGHPILADPDLRRVGEHLVLYPTEVAAIRPLVDRLLLSLGQSLPPRRIETVSGAFGRAFTRDSDAVWFISAGVVARDVAEGRLVRLPVATRLTEGPVGVMTRANAPRTLAGTLFLDIVTRHDAGRGA